LPGECLGAANQADRLDARRAETNYFLLHDPDDIARNRVSLRQLEKTIQACRTLQPEEKPTFDDLEAQITFYRLSFSHAVGRLGDAMRAVRLLTSTDPAEAVEMAQVLEEENRNRRKIDEDTFAEAQLLAEEKYDSRDAAIVLHQEHWHPGVVGIVASRMVEKYYKPAIMHAKFLPSLKGAAKMSASDPDNTIFLNDDPETVIKKVNRAITGQQSTAELQRKLGGNPDKCAICQYYRYLFEPDDKKLTEILNAEKKGTLLAGEHKKDMAERINKFLEQHRKKRDAIKGRLNEFMLKD
jgi:tryptophanyl-tRNA synthetase